MKRKQIINITVIVSFALFIVISYFMAYTKGQEVGLAFGNMIGEMLLILPCAFILIGLFEVWIKRQTVIQRLGEDSGIQGYLWVLLLAGVSVGGLYVALPLAESLHKKGASLKVIFTYLGFAGVFRIPMTIFEMSFLGLPFTLTRIFVALPLFLFSGIVFGTILKKKAFNFRNQNPIK